MLLRKKFKTKISEEKKERGISLDDLKGKELLMVELSSRDHSATSEADFPSKQQHNDKETTKDIQKKAMENLGK